MPSIVSASSIELDRLELGGQRVNGCSSRDEASADENSADANADVIRPADAASGHQRANPAAGRRRARVHQAAVHMTGWA
jgi:hypothetical protein